MAERELASRSLIELTLATSKVTSRELHHSNCDTEARAPSQLLAQSRRSRSTVNAFAGLSSLRIFPCLVLVPSLVLTHRGHPVTAQQGAVHTPRPAASFYNDVLLWDAPASPLMQHARGRSLNPLLLPGALILQNHPNPPHLHRELRPPFRLLRVQNWS